MLKAFKRWRQRRADLEDARIRRMQRAYKEALDACEAEWDAEVRRVVDVAIKEYFDAKPRQR